jgi:DNA-damage-inducible protein D
MSQETTPNFNSIRQLNPYGVEYWSARDLMGLLGYSLWQNFNIAIKRAITSCEQTGNSVADHFPETTRPIVSGRGRVQQIKDYTLSRFACFLIAQNGEPSKPEIAAAQVYFAVSTRENELRKLAEEQEERLYLREKVNEANKDLAKAAYKAGVLSRSFGKFQNAGYAGLYNGLDVEAIKTRKGIGPKEDLLDRIGKGELFANGLRATLTEEKLRKEGIVGETAASQAHHTVGKSIRKAIADVGGTMPEDLPAEPSIKPLLEQKKRRTKKQIEAKKNQDGSDGGPIQEQLF